jgi:alkanesulfonate monooxygenase SsuD/methylene tetrahydromethanopterin reductase-like flavin-dependent oxidoreductase (luciferase family)
MAMMLLQKNATVTICHSATPDLKAMTLQADVIVAAVGKRNVLTADMVKPGAVVLDVGLPGKDGVAVLEAWRKAGRGVDVPNDRLAYAALVYVGETEQEALEGAEKLLWYVTANKVAPQYANPPGYVPVSASAAALKSNSDARARSNDGLRQVTLEQQRELGVVIYGTPDQVAAQIRQEYERVGGFDHLLMMMQAGFLDHKSTVRNMTLFAKEVYPQIRDLPGTRQIMAAAAE